MINNPIIYKLFKDFTNCKTKTNRTAVFGSRPFLNILKYRGRQWDLSNIWKTRIFETYWRVLFVFMKVQAHSSLEPLLEYAEDQIPLMSQGLLWPFWPSWELQKYYTVFVLERKTTRVIKIRVLRKVLRKILLYQMQRTTPLGRWIEEA